MLKTLNRLAPPRLDDFTADGGKSTRGSRTHQDKVQWGKGFNIHYTTCSSDQWFKVQHKRRPHTKKILQKIQIYKTVLL